MIYHFLSLKLTTILFYARLFGSEYDYDAFNMDSLSSLYYKQDSDINDIPAEPLKDDIANTLLANKNFCSFINLIKNLREKLNNVNKNKSIQSLKSKALDLAKSLMEESLMASKMYHNRVGFFVYLSKSIDLIDDFLPCFNKKKNYESEIILPEAIKLVVLEIHNVEVLLPVIINILEKEEKITKAFSLKYIKHNLIKLEKHSYDLKECFEHYWPIFTIHFQFYNDKKFQPDELLIKLKYKIKIVLIMNETRFQKQSNLYNNVYVFFKDLYKCLENERVCLSLIFKDLYNIWLITGKIIDQLNLL